MNYEYLKRGNQWAVYDPNGRKVESYFEREDARKKVFELNGWTYPPKVKQP